jgi:hypothetical protein
LARRGRTTNQAKNETVAIYHGINPRTFEVETVYVTRDGHMTKYGKDLDAYTHYSAHGNLHEVEIRIVFELRDMFWVHPQFSNEASTRERLEELKAKATQMRAEKEANEKSAGTVPGA